MSADLNIKMTVGFNGNVVSDHQFNCLPTIQHRRSV